MHLLPSSTDRSCSASGSCVISDFSSEQDRGMISRSPNEIRPQSESLSLSVEMNRRRCNGRCAACGGIPWVLRVCVGCGNRVGCGRGRECGGCSSGGRR